MQWPKDLRRQIARDDFPPFVSGIAEEFRGPPDSSALLIWRAGKNGLVRLRPTA
jgi:hypothetical protein